MLDIVSVDKYYYSAIVIGVLIGIYLAYRDVESQKRKNPSINFFSLGMSGFGMFLVPVIILFFGTIISLEYFIPEAILVSGKESCIFKRIRYRVKDEMHFNASNGKILNLKSADDNQKNLVMIINNSALPVVSVTIEYGSSGSYLSGKIIAEALIGRKLPNLGKKDSLKFISIPAYSYQYISRPHFLGYENIEKTITIKKNEKPERNAIICGKLK